MVYTYDAIGRVVEANSTQYLYTPNGTMAASATNSTTLAFAYIPLPGGGTAIYKNSAGSVTLDHYRRPDWIGSGRVMSTPSQGLYWDTAYAPFGEYYNNMGTRDLTFAQMSQDIPDGGGNYVSPLRHYSAAQGRWLSPDPQSGNLYDPQMLNRYAYARNAPLTNVDPSGADPGDGSGDGGTWVDGYLAWFGDSQMIADQFYWQSGPFSGFGSGSEMMGPWFGNSIGQQVLENPILANTAHVMNTVTGVYAVGATAGAGAAFGTAVGIGELAVGAFHAGVSAYYIYGVPLVANLACAELCNGMSASAPALAMSELGSESSALVPRGFESATQFEQATQELEQALVESGISDATIGVRGSSITGFSHEGVPFDGGPKPSDIDFFAESKQLTEGLRTSTRIPGFVHPGEIQRSFAPIAQWSERWTQILGRKVSVGGFRPGMAPTGVGVLR